MATNTQTVKSKGPAPTVDQINADRITQVRNLINLDVHETFCFLNISSYKLDWMCCLSACKSVLGTVHHRKPSSI
jgi:hypothetical protein